MTRVTLLDYGAGNVKSLYNALVALGCDVEQTDKPEAVASAAILFFPGVGAFGSCMAMLERKQLVEPLRAYIRAGRPFLGICLGMQTLFESSEESPGVAGLGVVPGQRRPPARPPRMTRGLERPETSARRGATGPHSPTRC